MDYPWKLITFIIIVVLLFVSLIGKPKQLSEMEPEERNAVKLLAQVNDQTVEGFDAYPYTTPSDLEPVVKPYTHTHESTHTHVPVFWKYKPVRHAKLNWYNGVEYVDRKPPCARGEYSCTPVTCPSIFEDGVVCWKCNSIIVSPQNNLGY